MKKKIRVVMIIQGYHPMTGGAEKQLKALVGKLRYEDVEVYVLTRRYRNLKKFEIIDGISVYRLPIPGPKLVAAISFIFSALLKINKLKPDILHAHELLSPSVAATLAKFLFGKPVVVKVLRGGKIGDLAKLSDKPLGKFRIMLLRRWVNVFIAISHEIDRELERVRIPLERRVFIPNGVDLRIFKPVDLERKNELRLKLGFPAGVPIAIFNGRLEPEKRIDQLISIWPEVRSAHPGAQLLLLGSGSEEFRLRGLAGESVHFLGWMDDVVPYLQLADLFVLPSTTEGLSNSMLEALAVGLGVVATDVGGAPDVIDHQKTGWLIPPDSVMDLKESIIKLFNEPNLMITLGQNGHQVVYQKYSLSRTVSRLKSLYSSLIEV